MSKIVIAVQHAGTSNFNIKATSEAGELDPTSAQLPNHNTKLHPKDYIFSKLIGNGPNLSSGEPADNLEELSTNKDLPSIKQPEPPQDLTKQPIIKIYNGEYWIIKINDK